MSHDIKLNTAIDLNFKIIKVELPEVVTRVAYSADQARFIDIETTRFQGYVDITYNDPSEWIVEIDGQRLYENVTFDATEHEYPEGTRTILWGVYSITSQADEEIENVATFDIPSFIVDMLL